MSARCPPATTKAAREAAGAAGALLILDEVQTGIGRTGKWLASGDAGIVPDAVTLAKGLGGGFPIGALITFGPETSSLLSAGQHGTTFGGNPVATAAALATLHVLENQQVLTHVREVGEHLRSGLAAIDGVTEVRGEGLLIGFDLDADIAAGRRHSRPGRGLHRQQPRPAHHPARAAVDPHHRPGRPLPRGAARPPPDRKGRPVNATEVPKLTLKSQTRHFLKDTDLTPAEQAEVLDLAVRMKAAPYSVQPYAAEGSGRKTVAVIFDKTSTRTRVSFAAGVADMGGNALIINPGEAQIGHKESVEDTAKVLERMVSTIVWRTGAHSGLVAMAANSGAPVINALCDDYHPCQLLADLLTVKEHKGELKGLTMSYLGDAANNMANSYLLAGVTAGMHVRIAGPAGLLAAPGHHRGGRRPRRGDRRLGARHRGRRRGAAGGRRRRH